MYPKIEIEFGQQGDKHFCGIGDGIHDGLYGEGETKEAAALDFINKYNTSKYTFSEMPKPEKPTYSNGYGKLTPHR